MKVNVTALFDITLDSDDGNSKTTVTFSLPDYPKLKISDNVKKLTIEEVERICRAMMDRKVFKENAQLSDAKRSE